MELQDRPRRNFDPAMSRRYGWGKLNPDELVKYSPKWKYSRLFYLPSSGGRSRPSMRTIVISVDGGSRGNNRNNPNSLAAYGVYFGPNCPRNTRGLLDPDDPQTSSRAELEAVHKALLYVQGMTMFGELDGWHEVILKLDSEYVAKSFSEWIWKWEDNNYYSSKGRPLEHRDLIRDIHDLITELENDMAVRFWRVGREWNKEADALVNQALDDDPDSDLDWD